MDEKENEFDENDNTYDFINKNKKTEKSEKDFLDEEKENNYKSADDTDDITDDNREEKGIIKRFIPDTGMFNNKNLKIMGFVLIAMIFSFGILPKFMSDRKKKDKKSEEIAIANPEAMKVNDLDGENSELEPIAEIETPADPNAPVNPNEMTDSQLPSYYNNNSGNDIPMDNISMNDIRSNTKQAYDLSDVDGLSGLSVSSRGRNENGVNTGSSRVFDEIDSGSSSISSENPSTNNNRNSGNKKRGLEFVSSKGNAENAVNSQNSSYSGQTQQPQQTQDYDQNRQASKQKFLNFDRNGDFVSKKFLNRSYSKFELKTGHIIHGIMITGVNSDLPGQVLGQISQNVYDTVTGKHLLIPMGTKIYGTYDSNVTYGQNRLLLVWQRLVFPNGYTLELENLQGADLMGQAGFKGRVNNHFLKLLRSVLLSSAVTAATSRLDNVNVNVDTGNRSRVSIGTGASTASEKIQSIGEKLVEKDLNRQPTIYVKKGHKFNIIVNKDIILVPYNQLRR